MTEKDSELVVNIAGNIDPEQAREIEEVVWEKLHFASHLRSERLGQFTVGNDLERSESLALVQLLILYHLVTAKAAVALGGEGPRLDGENGDREKEKQNSEPVADTAAAAS
jgi:phosphoribulokinase